MLYAGTRCAYARIYARTTDIALDISANLYYTIKYGFGALAFDALRPQGVGRENKMSEVRLKENESLDSALRRFKRSCAKSGVLQEVRKREHYEKPSVKRKKKSEAARKRKFK